jgi:hypothetical protein
VLIAKPLWAQASRDQTKGESMNKVVTATSALSMLVRCNSRRLVVAAVLASVAVIIPGVAGAAPAVPKGQTTTTDFPAGELCAFPVRITTVYGQTTHDTGQGDTLVTGPFTATVTNQTTGATRTFNISGPTFLRTGPDVPTLVTGPNLILQPASRNVGPAFLIYTTGRVTFAPDFTIASRTGNVTDVCAELG